MRLRTTILGLFLLYSIYSVAPGEANPQFQGAEVPPDVVFQDCLQKTGEAYRLSRSQFITYARDHSAEVLRFLGDQGKSDDFRTRIMTRTLDAWIAHSDLIHEQMAAIKRDADKSAGKGVAQDPMHERQGIYAQHADAIMMDSGGTYRVLRCVAVEQMWKGPESEGEFAPICEALALKAGTGWYVNSTKNSNERIDHALLCLWLALQDVKGGKKVLNSYYSDAWRRALHPAIVQHLKEWRTAETSSAGKQFLDRLIPGVEARVAGKPYVEQSDMDHNPRIDDLRRELSWHEQRIADTPELETRAGQAQLRDKTQYFHQYLESKKPVLLERLSRETDPQDRYWTEQALQWVDEEFPKAKARYPMPACAPTSRPRR